eukprot:1194322-Prorocentrum_minimum.AAC.8
MSVWCAARCLPKVSCACAAFVAASTASAAASAAAASSPSLSSWHVTSATASRARSTWRRAGGAANRRAPLGAAPVASSRAARRPESSASGGGARPSSYTWCIPWCIPVHKGNGVIRAGREFKTYYYYSYLVSVSGELKSLSSTKSPSQSQGNLKHTPRLRRLLEGQRLQLC